MGWDSKVQHYAVPVGAGGVEKKEGGAKEQSKGRAGQADGGKEEGEKQWKAHRFAIFRIIEEEAGHAGEAG